MIFYDSDMGPKVIEKIKDPKRPNVNYDGNICFRYIKKEHPRGTAVPSAWHNLAIALAQLCHQGGTAVPR